MTADAALTLRVPADLRDALTATAAAYRVPRSVIVRDALTAWATGSAPMLPPVPDGPPAQA